MRHEHTHRDIQTHDQPHGHAHGRAHGLGVAAVRAGVHRLGRRRFLAELGRNTVAVAILGGAVAACSGDDDDGTGSYDRGRGDGGTSGTSGTSVEAAASGTDAAAATSEPTDPAALQWAQVSLGFVSAYVLVRGNEAAVVDTGTSGSADAIGATLSDLGVTFDDVRHVVLTHHHPDHVGSLPAVLERAPSATAYAGELDLPNITAAAIGVGDGDDVFGLQVIETPGHTPGSISVLDTGIGLLIAGDALNGDDSGTAITGPNPDFTADMDVATASVAKLAALTFGAAAFGHGQPVREGADELVRLLVG